MTAQRSIRTPDDWKNCEVCNKAFRRDSRYSRAYFAKQRFCCAKCYGEFHSASSLSKASLAERFWRDVDERDFGKCWEWKGCRTKGLYGAMGFGGKTLRPHRVSLEISGRPVPKGMHACHTCNNKICVNPFHLYIGTPGQNSRDAALAGSHAKKLTVEDVVFIRSSSLSISELADKFGVTGPAISKVIKRKSWKHV